MCTESQLSEIMQEIAKTAKEVFSTKLDTVYLYGSYARGDFDRGSDIDVMILVDVPKEELFRYKRPFNVLSSALGLEYDTLITITLKDIETFRKYIHAVPFYQTIQEEGVAIAV